VLFVLVTVLAAGWLWQQRNDREEVLAVGVAVPAGVVIERDDLRVQEVAGVDAAISSADLDGIVGSTAAVSLVPGQILNQDMLSSDPMPGPGERVVGVELDATRTPGGLMPGHSVTVLAVPPSGDPGSPSELESPPVLAENVTLLKVATVQGAGTRLTLVVPEPAANSVAAFGSAGRVAVVQTPVSGDR
jgi:Flp pilus assembly protein CpaB